MLAKLADPPVFSEVDRETWRTILTRHQKMRSQQVCDLFLRGVETLGLNADHLPDLYWINKVLKQRTGFEGVFVEGLEDGQSFFSLLADRKFPVGSFIRDAKDLGYTPAPDVVHDLYGHLPFYTDREYADFSQKFGETAIRFADSPKIFRQFERFFWFTLEFALIDTPGGTRVFGAGIASSTDECAYALSDASEGGPEVRPFDVDSIRHQEFRIDEMQKVLFKLKSTQQLYSSLDVLNEKVMAEL